jgi:hypothetical protein
MRVRATGMAAASIVLALVAIPSWPQIAVESGPVYVLSERATYQSGCFPPCLCPVLEQAPVRGTFRLTFTGFDGLFNTYVVSDVSWAVDIGGSELLISGSGNYKLGGEVALTQRLDLDLVIDGNPVQHFTSGLVPTNTAGLPDINVAVSMNHMSCHDTAIVVDALPAPASSIPAVQRWALLSLGMLILIFAASPMLHRRANP